MDCPSTMISICRRDSGNRPDRQSRVSPTVSDIPDFWRMSARSPENSCACLQRLASYVAVAARPLAMHAPCSHHGSVDRVWEARAAVGGSRCCNQGIRYIVEIGVISRPNHPGRSSASLSVDVCSTLPTRIVRNCSLLPGYLW